MKFCRSTYNKTIWLNIHQRNFEQSLTNLRSPQSMAFKHIGIVLHYAAAHYSGQKKTMRERKMLDALCFGSYNLTQSNRSLLYTIYPRVSHWQPLQQGWRTCGPRAECGPLEHLMWPTSEFSLPMFEYKIAYKRSSVTSRYLDSTLRVVTLPHS